MNLPSGRTTVLCTLKKQFLCSPSCFIISFMGCERVCGKLGASSFLFFFFLFYYLPGCLDNLVYFLTNFYIKKYKNEKSQDIIANIK